MGATDHNLTKPTYWLSRSRCDDVISGTLSSLGRDDDLAQPATVLHVAHGRAVAGFSPSWILKALEG